MLDSFVSSLIGLPGVDLVGNIISKLTSDDGSSEDSSLFGDQLKAAIAANGDSNDAGSIVKAVGKSMSGIIDKISSSKDISERQNLAILFRDSVKEALEGAGYTVTEGTDPDKLVVNGVNYDILGSLNSPGKSVSVQFLEYEGIAGATVASSSESTPARSAREVVMATAAESEDLISKIEGASTVDERVNYVIELRDRLIAALQAEGYDAKDIGKRDIIELDGVRYDVVRASNGVGMSTDVMWLQVGYAPGYTGSTDEGGTTGSLVGDIFAAGSSGTSLLNQISQSTDLEERRELGLQFTQLVVDGLNSRGHTASLHDDPDKIIVDGQTVDVIRSLNTPGAQALLQALYMA